MNLLGYAIGISPINASAFVEDSPVPAMVSRQQTSCKQELNKSILNIFSK